MENVKTERYIEKSVVERVKYGRYICGFSWVWFGDEGRH